MTREEEIWNAINNLQIGNYNEDDPSDNDEYDGSDLQNAFCAGAKWADANPKSPWISVEDDLPCNYKELMRTREVREGTETVDVFATSKSGIIWSDYMIYENGKWRWNGNYFNPDFWMLAPKLPKE